VDPPLGRSPLLAAGSVRPSSAPTRPAELTWDTLYSSCRPAQLGSELVSARLMSETEMVRGHACKHEQHIISNGLVRMLAVTNATRERGQKPLGELTGMVSFTPSASVDSSVMSSMMLRMPPCPARDGTLHLKLCHSERRMQGVPPRQLC
jgi:hypothetical protein